MFLTVGTFCQYITMMLNNDKIKINFIKNIN